MDHGVEGGDHTNGTASGYVGTAPERPLHVEEHLDGMSLFFSSSGCGASGDRSGWDRAGGLRAGAQEDESNRDQPVAWLHRAWSTMRPPLGADILNAIDEAALIVADVERSVWPDGQAYRPTVHPA